MGISIEFLLETFVNSIRVVPLTLSLALVPFLIGSLLAFPLALAQVKQKKFFSKFASAYVALMQGTPAVVLVLLIYNTLPGQLAKLVKSLGLNFNVYRQIPAIAYAYFIFSLTAIAFLIEIFRSAILSVNKGQMEAALSIGLSEFQAYTRIIIPQAIKSTLPNICNLVVALVKNTSLAFLMTVKDLTQTAKLGAALNYRYAEAYIVILIIYIVICLLIEGIFKLIEKEINHEFKKRVSIKGIS